MMGTNFPEPYYLPPEGTDPFEKVKEVLLQADILFGNLEGTLTDEGQNAKHCSDPSKCYSFRSPEAYGKFLEDAGFDVMSVANNHIGDFGDIGIKNTTKTLEQHNIAYAGVFAQPSTIFEKDGITYGFCAFAPNKDCLKIHNLTKAKEIVKATNEQWEHIGKKELADKYDSKLLSIWPDIRQGDSLTLVTNEQGMSTFYHNDEKIGEINESQFSDDFLAIWLNEKTSEPKLRKQLLGN